MMSVGMSLWRPSALVHAGCRPLRYGRALRCSGRHHVQQILAREAPVGCLQFEATARQLSDIQTFQMTPAKRSVRRIQSIRDQNARKPLVSVVIPRVFFVAGAGFEPKSIEPQPRNATVCQLDHKKRGRKARERRDRFSFRRSGEKVARSNARKPPENVGIPRGFLRSGGGI